MAVNTSDGRLAAHLAVSQAVCSNCRRDASFTKRTVDEEGIEVRKARDAPQNVVAAQRGRQSEKQEAAGSEPRRLSRVSTMRGWEAEVSTLMD
jgi:hypothetical protein